MWTGDGGNDDMTAAGTVAGTCDDWTDAGGTGSIAVDSSTTSSFWQGSAAASCATNRRIYCVEQ